MGGAGQRNQASLNIALKPRAERSRSQKQVEEAMRSAIAKIPGTDASVGFDRPIYVAILGSDAEGPARVADEFAEKVKKIPGAVDVESSVKPGLPAYAVRLKPLAVRELGLTAPQLASSLRAYVTGETATHWTTPDGDPVDVVLRLNETGRQRIEQLKGLPVAFAKDGTPISLDSVATIETMFTPEIIRCQNLQRREAVFAGVQGRSAGEVGDDVQALIKETTLPPGYSFDVGGQMQQQAEAFNGLLAAMALAVIFIYLVLASQFGSFLQPLAIMASLPLALIGVMLALLLWRSTLNVFSMIGLVMLMGLVTKNAILLVDFANPARRAGAGMADALLQAGLIRLRPIVMTTMAMVFGMLPLALAFNDGGELQAPMGLAIIGGILTSTLLTLVVVPVLYSYLARERRKPVVVLGGSAAGLMPMPMPADRDLCGDPRVSRVACRARAASAPGRVGWPGCAGCRSRRRRGGLRSLDTQLFQHPVRVGAWRRRVGRAPALATADAVVEHRAGWRCRGGAPRQPHRQPGQRCQAGQGRLHQAALRAHGGLVAVHAGLLHGDALFQRGQGWQRGQGR